MNISMCGRCDGYKPPRSHHGKCIWSLVILEKYATN
jgi:hypothetical protein